MDISNRASFENVISAVLEHEPDWLDAALRGIASGMSRAIRKADERAALKGMAALSAMALANKTRIGPELRATFEASIVAAIHPENQCGYERGYIDNYTASAIEARKGRDAKRLDGDSHDSASDARTNSSE
jgi:hypothetical protein